MPFSIILLPRQDEATTKQQEQPKPATLPRPLRLCQLHPFLPPQHETLEYYESTLESTSGSYMKMRLSPWLMLRGFGGSATSLQMSL